MQKKKTLKIMALFFLVLVCAGRIYVVNTDKKLPQTRIFSTGDAVPYGRDFNMSERDQCEGYYLTVLDTKIMEAGAFCEKYDAEDMGLATHYYVVDLEVENRSNEQIGEEGVALGIAMLIGTNYAIIPSPAMCEAANPDMPSLGFSLQYGTKKEVKLVFSVIPGNMPDLETIQREPPSLQITQYPVRKLIQLDGTDIISKL